MTDIENKVIPFCGANTLIIMTLRITAFSINGENIGLTCDTQH
jgi:hypothetical protein